MSAASERPWCPSGEPAAWGLSVGSRMTEYGGTKRVEVSSIRDGYVYVRDLPDEPSAATRREIYLTLHSSPDGSSASVAVPLDEALTLDHEGFTRLYRRHVHGASRREANEWADKQINERALMLKGGSLT